MDDENSIIQLDPGSVKSEMQALLKLIDEPDKHNYALIRERILSYGPAALSPLEGLLDHYFDELIQSRIESIIEDIQFQQVYDALKRWAKEESHNLLKGFFIISQFQYPHLVFKDILGKLEGIIRDVWLEMNDDLTALEKVKVLNHVIFDIHHFAPNKAVMHTPENFFINTLIESKKGSPLALGILYMLVAKSLGIPIFGVNLPQHFILAYTQEGTLDRDELPAVEDVLFYINPFNLGAVFTQHEIDLFLKHIKLENDAAYYQPCSHETILTRLINNLRLSYEKAHKEEKVEAMHRLLTALPKGNSAENLL